MPYTMYVVHYKWFHDARVIKITVWCISGNVVTMECVEMLIMKDMTDPTNGKKVTEKDIIPLQRVSSGNYPRVSGSMLISM